MSADPSRDALSNNDDFVRHAFGFAHHRTQALTQQFTRVVQDNFSTEMSGTELALESPMADCFNRA